MFRSLSLIVTLFVAGHSVAHAQPFFPFFEPVTPPRSVQVIAHRGLAVAAPENSAVAIEMCAEDYVEWAEIDVRLTKDGQHVIMHDATIDRTTNGKGCVADFTLDELKRLDAGSWFAPRFAGTRLLTLREALDLARSRINLQLDCKHVDPKLLVQEILAAGMDRQVVVHDELDVLSVVKRESKGTIARMMKFGPQMDFKAFVKEVAPEAVEVGAEHVTSELCERFHSRGIKVQAKVIGAHDDTAEVWKRVIDAGADWLQTDDAAGILFFNARRNLGRFPVQLSFHRGASRYAPENTVPAIREAARLGADYVELDLRTTKDGKTVLIHDGAVNRTTDGEGLVRELSYQELSVFSAGKWFGRPFRETRIPTLEAAILAFGDQMAGDLDLKEIALETLCETIQKHQLAERHIVYQKLEYCSELRRRDKTIRVTPPLKRLEELDAIAAIKPYGVDADWSILSGEMIAECHRRGLVVFSDASGPNETVEQYRKAMEWGIDCIRTDHPLRVLRAIELSSAAKIKK